MLDTLDFTGSEAQSPGYKRFAPFSGSFGFGMKGLRESFPCTIQLSKV